MLGWVAIVPAAVLLVLSYGLPTVELLTRADGHMWEFITSDQFLNQLGYALSFAVVPILLFVTVAPALAWAAARAGLVARFAVRATLALPLAAFAPVGLATVWLADRLRDRPLGERIDGNGREAMLATMTAFVLALAITCYLAALRRREPGERTTAAVAVVTGLLSVVALGAAVQQFTFTELIDVNPATGELRGTPAGYLPRFMPVVDVVPLVLLSLLALLGVVATVLVLVSRLRLEADPTLRAADDVRPGPGRWPAVIGAIVGFAIMAVLTIVQVGPWLAGVVGGSTAPPEPFTSGSVLAHTWWVTLLAALIQVGVAALAAFGIAVVRPLGRHSEWLLLAFAPWLLVGNGLIMRARLEEPVEGLQPLLAYAPPSWLSIPALFVFTLLFRGQALAWRRLRDAGRPYPFLRAMWPALPMLPFATGVAWLLQA